MAMLAVISLTLSLEARRRYEPVYPVAERSMIMAAAAAWLSG